MIELSSSIKNLIVTKKTRRKPSYCYGGECGFITTSITCCGMSAANRMEQFVMTLDQIEHKISGNDMSAMQVFTQMMQHVNSRNSVIDEAIAAIQSCELVDPNVKRIRLHEALGALIELKS